jgi:tripartite-type tricarboxylate transporter receptor subunit TctC
LVLRISRIAAAITLALALPVQAQTYPTKPIVVVVPSAAGGPADVAIRAIAEPLSQALGQQIVVDNMAGAGGTLGMARVARAEPDGHTLLIHQNGFAIAPALYRSLPFDTEKDFVAVGLVNRSHLIWAGRSTLPANTFAEMVTWMKGPGKPAKVAHPGVGTLGHLQTTMFISGIGVEVSMVPYRGIAPAVKDLLGGHVDMAQIGAAVASAQVTSGNLKIFAVGAERRDPLFPDVPTYVELGYKGMDKPFWHALFAPAKTPQPVLERVNAALRTALSDPKVLEAYKKTFVQPYPEEQQSLDAAQKYVRDEIVFWGKVVRDNDVKIARCAPARPGPDRVEPF